MSSFYAVYKQGRFRRPGSEGTQDGMQQVERFAVAMLALALKHEPTFQRNFLREVCGRKQLADDGRFVVEIEVTGCGDLLLLDDRNSEAYFLEFKVESPIEPRQDPRNLEFFTNGYGAGIKKRRWKRSTYILVQNHLADLRDAAEKIPVCLGKSWRDVYRCPQENPLIRDLFESFGLLGIPEFIHMNTKDMSLGCRSTILETAKIHELLKAVAGRIGSNRRRPVAHWWPDEDGAGDVGLDFAPTDGSDEWQKLVQPKKETGWFGYCHHSQRPTLQVWFFCGNRKAAAGLAALIKKRLAQKKGEVKVDPEQNVIISLPAESSADNQGWFISVFESLVQRK